MKKLVSLLALIAIVFVACNKDPNDPREQFVGSWKGTITVNATTSIPIIINIQKDPVASNKLIIITPDGKTTSAAVSGNTLSIAYSGGIPGFYSGEVSINGTVSGNSMAISGTILVTENGATTTKTIPGTTLTKVAI